MPRPPRRRYILCQQCQFIKEWFNKIANWHLSYWYESITNNVGAKYCRMRILISILKLTLLRPIHVLSNGRYDYNRKCCRLMLLPCMQCTNGLIDEYLTLIGWVSIFGAIPHQILYNFIYYNAPAVCVCVSFSHRSRSTIFRSFCQYVIVPVRYDAGVNHRCVKFNSLKKHILHIYYGLELT